MNKFLVAALGAATLLASCSKENNPGTEAPADPAKLKISVVGTDLSKAVDADQGAVVTDITAFILNADNALLVDPIYITGADLNSTTKEYAVTTAAKHVAIVANTGDLTGSGKAFNGLGTLAQVKAALASYGDLTPTTKVWMSGVTASELSFTGTASDGTSKLAAAQVTLSIIPTRIDVQVVNNMSNYGSAGALVLDGVAVLYSAGYSHYLATSGNYSPTTAAITAISGKYYRSGLANWTSQLTANDQLDANLNKAYADGFNESFYALPGKGAHGANTIVTVHGTFNSQKRYFPVHFSATDVAGTQLENGKWYTVKITLNGDALEGGGGGDDPGIEVVDAFITVEVTPAGWDVVTPTIEKPFN